MLVWSISTRWWEHDDVGHGAVKADSLMEQGVVGRDKVRRGQPEPSREGPRRDRFSITKVNRASRCWTRNRDRSRRGLFECRSTRSTSSRVHRNRLRSNRLARIGTFPRWSMRGNLTGECPRPGRSAPVTSGPGRPTTLHSTHTARPLTWNKLSRRTNSSLQPPIHPNMDPRKSTKTPQQISTTNNMSSNCQIKELRRNTRSIRDSNRQLINSNLAGNPERHRFANEVSYKDLE